MTDTPNADPLREAAEQVLACVSLRERGIAGMLHTRPLIEALKGLRAALAADKDASVDVVASGHGGDESRDKGSSVLAADAPEGPYQMDAVDDIPRKLKDKIGRAVAEEVARQAASGVVDHFRLFRAGLWPCREKLNQLTNGETDV